MRQPNIHEVRENLAEYLEAAARGEEVLICRRNQPVARLVGIARPPRKPRPVGRAVDAGAGLPASFWEPLPDSLMAAFEGRSVPLPAPSAPHRRSSTAAAEETPRAPRASRRPGRR